MCSTPTPLQYHVVAIATTRENEIRFLRKSNANSIGKNHNVRNIAMSFERRNVVQKVISRKIQETKTKGQENERKLPASFDGNIHLRGQ